MKKFNCYDPRISRYVDTDNPALILGSIIFRDRSRLYVSDDTWDRIAAMADYCDEMVEVPAGLGAVKLKTQMEPVEFKTHSRATPPTKKETGDAGND